MNGVCGVVQWGTVGEWVSGLGALAAVIVAVVFGIRSERSRKHEVALSESARQDEVKRREAAEAELRKLREAEAEERKQAREEDAEERRKVREAEAERLTRLEVREAEDRKKRELAEEHERQWRHGRGVAIMLGPYNHQARVINGAEVAIQITRVVVHARPWLEHADLVTGEVDGLGKRVKMLDQEMIQPVAPGDERQLDLGSAAATAGEHEVEIEFGDGQGHRFVLNDKGDLRLQPVSG